MSQENHTVAYAASGIPEQLPAVPKVELLPHAASSERLNVVLPNYFKNYAFGGIASAMELAREISRHYEAVRFLSLSPLGGAAEMFDFTDYVVSGAKKNLGVETLHGREILHCHDREIFLCTYWKTVLIWDAYTQALQNQGFQPNPFYYFIQDYEPGFYAFGTKHALCLCTYAHGEHTHALFNAAELARHFKQQGLHFAREYTLLPSLNPVIAARLRALNYMLPLKPVDKVTMVIYGRPQSRRNCFNSLMAGLYRCFQKLSEEQRQGVEIVSAGLEHPDIELCPGVVVRSVGKLDLESYVALLERAHLGVSLMASPHPSYPPLEMAVMGLAVITNRFGSKDLSLNHPGIRSIDAPCPRALAEELVRTLNDVRQGVCGRGGEPARLPSNMSPRAWADNLRRLNIQRLAAAE